MGEEEAGEQMRKSNRFIRTIAFLIAISSLMWRTEAASAETWYYSMGTSGFQQQERTLWCWVAAARNMAVARFTSVNVSKSQSDVVKEIKGSVVNKDGSLKETSKAVDSFSKSGTSKAIESQLSFQLIKAQIVKQKAVILGMHNVLDNGHATLLYGYDSDSTKVKVYDSQMGNIICKFADLRDGKTLSGYTYQETIYYN